ncbi:hypothetical protein C2G38_2151570 [Gigaspora rosea]|uniref:Large ribosomal subunit protein mL53 n=1 Tax=Gigaspora rosea TaxID=44941 RepID=A0A397WAI7_9GLOM|nr:hypothetical protein C2G38_2151570 [Gigaspora rosea]
MLKYINQVDIKFAPFSKASKSSRLFLNRIMTDKARLANPNAIINTVILSDVKKDPRINITYSDGKKIHIRAGDKTIEHVLTIVNKHLRKLQDDEDFAT